MNEFRSVFDLVFRSVPLAGQRDCLAAALASKLNIVLEQRKSLYNLALSVHWKNLSAIFVCAESQTADPLTHIAIAESYVPLLDRSQTTTISRENFFATNNQCWAIVSGQSFLELY